MTTTHQLSAVRVLSRGLALAGVISALALPALASAQMYAYVNQQGEVRTVEATTWESAIQTAPSIHPRSGVIIITSPSDDIVGNDVSGI